MTPDLPQVEQVIVEMTNVFRAEQKLTAVRRSARLDQIARRYAKFLADNKVFSHTADGRQPADRAGAGGYNYCMIAENLSLNLDSRGFKTRQLARDAVEGWKNSPGHRRNLVAPSVTEIGVGVAKALDKQQYLSVQLFGRPAELRFSFKLRNTAGQTVAYTVGDSAYNLKPNVEVTHTVCRPLPLRFPEIQARGNQAMATFEGLQRDDLFLVRKGEQGRLVVTHQPSVQ